MNLLILGNRMLILWLAALLLSGCFVDDGQTVGTDRPSMETLNPLRFRQPIDPVGYAHTREGIEKVVAMAIRPEEIMLDANRLKLGLDQENGFIAAISPHDDYLYAQQVYVHVFPHIQARHVIVIGVAHRARSFPECEGKLVFDDFPAWQGPYGGVVTSVLRDDLLSALPAKDVTVSREMHASEHSIEGLLPFLQHYNREAAIVPILVPYMAWERLSELAYSTATALSEILEQRGLSLGKDVALLISNDGVHYGDQDWGGREFAEFGTSGAAYDMAVSRDLDLIDRYLTEGATPEKAEGFYRAVNDKNYYEACVSWCGRFSIPFGLATLTYLHDLLGRPRPNGTLLRYGTTLDPGRAESDIPGLGVTARANLHHWVGFCAVGYR